MKNNRDHFDRGFAGSTDRSDEREPSRVGRVTATAPAAAPTRGPRHVGQTPCPHCFYPNGVTYHGELRDGQKVYQLASHSTGAGNRRDGKPACKGAFMRLERLTDGTWKALK